MRDDQQAIGGPQGVAHIPVLLDAVLEALSPLDGVHVIDGTFGAGGYSRALLKAGAEVTGIDRDPNVQKYADMLLADYADRFSFSAGEFSRLDEIVQKGADRVVLDIGVSSMQLDEAERGFSFMREGPLDMRMAGEGQSAADLVNTLSQSDLANLIFAFGEERKSRRIAAAIVAARTDAPIKSTLELAGIIEKAIGRKPGDMHPATRSFQALRIAVNAEFDQLIEGLFAAERVLPEGGKLAVVTFHSLEDRIVKRFFSAEKAAPAQSRHMPITTQDAQRWEDVIKPVKASKSELERNPRARSATLRAGTRTGAPARPVSAKGLGLPNPNLKGAA